MSSLGVIGVRNEITTDLGAMAALSDGVIVGSAIVKLVAQYGRGAVPFVRDYVAGIKAAIIGHEA